MGLAADTYLRRQSPVPQRGHSMTNAQALTQALILAITAPDDLRAQQAIDLSEELAQRLNSSEVDQCKADALLILEMA
jgi:hypothetical protein